MGPRGRALSLDTNPAYLFFEQLTRQFSPYELNPLDINPLRDLLAREVDFERVNRCDALKVFVTATNARTGRARSFSQPQLSVDAVMASACLPFMFKAVEIDGEACWDGGTIGNPALNPLVEETATRDLIIVQINPMVRDELPRTGQKNGPEGIFNSNKYFLWPLCFVAPRPSFSSIACRRSAEP